jgi:DNA-binding transcriptional LysR family regulator
MPKRSHQTDSLLKPNIALGLAKGTPLSVRIAKVGDRERVAVAFIGKHKLAFVIGAPQLVGLLRRAQDRPLGLVPALTAPRDQTITIQVTFNGTPQILSAALSGFGLAYVPEDVAEPHLARKRLVRVLEDWCQPYSGYHLYYPSRRQPSAAFSLLVDTLRYRD